MRHTKEQASPDAIDPQTFQSHREPKGIPATESVLRVLLVDPEKNWITLAAYYSNRWVAPSMWHAISQRYAACRLIANIAWSQSASIPNPLTCRQP
jgi:hypothetical protein